jgi:hypothetical protein
MKRSQEQVLLEIEKFLSDGGGAYDWDDFTSIKIDDPQLDAIRIFCADLPNLDPPVGCGQYCNENGLTRLRELAIELADRTPD